ncbi:lysine N(6)-hydroxylase/L-ornithine N(5)-oxygenase family protein [Flavobacterium sp. LS1R49]|uniref:Lysine N(6)-hydroxylase/L-ornithine N(5)-oxygenase family protein n=1 Tax=Flavobacterium shii TaxID=2987687 RepID=A0A9X2ZF34_9FLAO|nr:lysine N(6)-hydroxylase/L-ornithine N(5)-oxygenase family protein [Flavobacterium shii]MCV9928627.1 lysine N(6)-hydroxylase/L-ornithine N(5)-oxygenase family protein [Flavobacterium shii]
MDNKIYDYIGIGVGPFNLGLACLLDPIKELDGVFLDKKENFNWHAGMLLQDTTLQIPFLADLVTLADPTSSFSFLNYIKEQGRIYSFYIKENFLLLRNEYNLYCKWAIEKLKNIEFNTSVDQIFYSDEEQCYIVTTSCTQTNNTKIYKSKKLIFGTGTSPFIPACCKDLKDKIIHSSQYLDQKEELQTKKSITVLGSGQSAAEIYNDLLQEIDSKGYQLNWITRSARFFPLEYTKLTLEMTSPDYVDYFFSLPSQKRDQMNKEQKNLYKGINSDLINTIYDTLYTKSLMTKIDVSLRTNSELKKIVHNAVKNTFELEVHQVEQDKYYKHSTEAVVLATGYNYKMPDFVNGITSRIKWDTKNRFDVNRNYSIDVNDSEIFVQNAELHTHGFVTPDLGMACYRNSFIIKGLTGKDYYPIESRIAFQQFNVLAEEEIQIQESAIAQ